MPKILNWHNNGFGNNGNIGNKGNNDSLLMRFLPPKNAHNWCNIGNTGNISRVFSLFVVVGNNGNIGNNGNNEFSPKKCWQST